MGSVVLESDANYALLIKATQTVQKFLDSGIDNNLEIPTQFDAAIDDWVSILNPEPWNFEIEFWGNLADHPILSVANSTLQDLQ